MDKCNRLTSSDEKQTKSLKEKNCGKYSKCKKRSFQTNGSSNNAFIQEWMGRIEDRSNDQQGKYWQVHGQKLFSAISDPAVCGYSVPFGYPIDQVALPVYPVIPAAPVTRTFNPLVPYPEVKPRKKRQEECGKSTSKQTQYTSLPPGPGSEFGSDQRRRFSDPGLANAQLSEDSCSSSSTTDNELPLLEDIHKENDRLSKELNATKEELRALKTDVNTLIQAQQSYPVGSITEMVKEVGNAIDTREQVLFTKTQQMVKDLVIKLGEKIHNQTTVEEKGPSKEEFEEIQKKLIDVTKERDVLNQRVVKLESIQNTVSQRLGKLEEFLSNSPGEVNSPEIRQVSSISHLNERKLRKHILEAPDNPRQSDKGLSLLRIKPFVSKVSSSPSGEDKERSEGGNTLSSLDTCESLTSSVGSLHSPLVTMSGPVTDV